MDLKPLATTKPAASSSSSGLTGGLIPPPTASSNKSGAGAKIDYDIDDDNFDDILGLSSDSDDDVAGAKSGKHKKGSTKSSKQSEKSSTSDDVADDDMFDLLGLGETKAKKPEPKAAAPSFLSRTEPSFSQPTSAAAKPTISNAAMPSFLSSTGSESPTAGRVAQRQPTTATDSTNSAQSISGSGLFGSDPKHPSPNLFGKQAAEPAKPIFGKDPAVTAAPEFKSDKGKADDDSIPSFLLSSTGASAGRRRGGREPGTSTSGTISAGSPLKPPGSDPMDLIAAQRYRGVIYQGINDIYVYAISMSTDCKTLTELTIDWFTKAISKSESMSSVALLSDTDDEQSGSVLETKSKSELKGKHRSDQSRSRTNTGSTSSIKESLTEISRLKELLAAAEAKLVQEKAESESRHTDELTRLNRKHEQELQDKQEKHEKAIARIEQEAEEKVLRRTKLELDEQRISYERQLSDLKQSHLDEMHQLISSTESARQIAEIAGKMETNSKLIDTLQLRMEADHALSLQNREETLLTRERQVADLQTQLIKEKETAEMDRVRTQEMMERMEQALKSAKHHQEQEFEVIYRDKTRLAEQIAKVQEERDLMSFKLNQERGEFTVAREAWDIERRRMIAQITEEEKRISSERAEIASRERANKQLEEELAVAKNRHENQVQAERSMLDREMKLLQARFAEYHREDSRLRVERLKIDALKTQLDIERSVLESEQKTLEQNVRHAAMMHGEAARERHKAQSLQMAADVAMQQIETGKQEMLGDRKNYVDDRIALADIRNRKLLASGGSREVSGGRGYRTGMQVRGSGIRCARYTGNHVLT
eukprot:jgi/Hompol1/6914/HPOL_002366-RA